MKNKRILLVLSALLVCTMVSCQKKANTSSSEDTSLDSSVVSSVETPDAEAMVRTALEKEYENGTTVCYFTQTNKETNKLVASYVETDKQIDSNNYYKNIAYSTSDTEYECYVTEDDDTYDLVYQFKGKDAIHYVVSYDDWNYETEDGGYEFDIFANGYELPTNYGLEPTNYEYKDGKVVCKEDKLNVEGAKIFGDEDIDETSMTIKSLEFTFDDNGYFKTINIEHEITTEDATFIVTNDVTYSDIGSTNYTVPEVEISVYDPNPAPTHLDAADGVALTDEEKTTFNAAFAKTYTNYTSMFVAYSSFFGYEFNIYDYYFCDGNNVEDYVAMTLGGSDFGSYDILYKTTTDGSGKVTYNEVAIDENKNAYTTAVDDEDAPTAYQPGDFALKADDFVKITETDTVDGEEVTTVTYVVKPEALANVDMSAIIEDDPESEDPETLVTAEVRLQDSGDINSIYYITVIGEGREATYQEYLIKYSDIDDTTVDVPEDGSVLRTMTTDDNDDLKELIAGKYTDYEIYDDSISGDEFLFSSTSGMYLKVSENESGDYDYTYWAYTGGKYYTCIETATGGLSLGEEKTEAEFKATFPTFDFSAIDMDKVSYDTFNNGYYISADDIDLTAFTSYYDGDFLASVTGIEIIPVESETTGLEFMIVFEYTDDEGNFYNDQGITVYDANIAFAE